jgi:hypothetical protein
MIREDVLVLKRKKFPKVFLGIFLVGIIIITFDTKSETRAQQSIEAKLASCPNLPNVSWWKTTRIKIVNYVDLKYRGNWVPYIQKWETYKQKMQGILASNGTALVKSRNIRLYGDKLAFHIKEIERRLEVTKCLKDKFSGQLAYHDVPVLNLTQRSSNDKNIHFTLDRTIQISKSVKPAFIVMIDKKKTDNCDEGVLSELEKMFAEMCL